MGNDTQARRYFSWGNLIGAILFGVLLFNDLTGALTGSKADGVQLPVFAGAMMAWMLIDFVVKLSSDDGRLRYSIDNVASVLIGLLMITLFTLAAVNSTGWELALNAMYLLFGLAMVAIPVHNLVRMRQKSRSARAAEGPGER